jgi:hypothetical protein
MFGSCLSYRFVIDPVVFHAGVHQPSIDFSIGTTEGVSRRDGVRPGCHQHAYDTNCRQPLNNPFDANVQFDHQIHCLQFHQAARRDRVVTSFGKKMFCAIFPEIDIVRADR